MTYPIKEIFIETNTDNYIQEAANVVEKINMTDTNKQGENDILVFLPGMGEMKEFTKLMGNIFEKSLPNRPFIIVILDRSSVQSLQVYKYLKVDYNELRVNKSGLDDPKGEYIPYRRIFLGTVVAETGLTISTLGYVVDSGLVKQNEYYYPYNIGGLMLKPVPKSRAIQRRGRVGRKFPGTCYYLYTEDTMKDMAEQQLPDIVLDGTKQHIITIMEKQKDLTKLDMLDAPAISTLKHGLTSAIVMGVFNPVNYDTRKMAENLGKCLYIPLESYRMLRSAYIYNVSIPDICTIMAMTQEWMRPWKIKTKEILEVSIPKFFKKDIDVFSAITLDQFIEELFFFNAFAIKATSGTIKSTQEWCESVGLKFNDFLAIIKTRANIMTDITTLQLLPLYGQENSLDSSTVNNYLDRIKNIKRCLYDGYRLNLIQFDRNSLNYINRFDQKVMGPKGLPSDLRKECNIIATNKITIVPADRETYRKNIAIDRWSVLDGYVGVDQGYLDPV